MILYNFVISQGIIDATLSNSSEEILQIEQNQLQGVIKIVSHPGVGNFVHLWTLCAADSDTVNFVCTCNKENRSCQQPLCSCGKLGGGFLV